MNKRWPPPVFGETKHALKEGDGVVIARLCEGIPTDSAILGHHGFIIDVDDVSSTMVEMKCLTCGGIHTMHEDELDFTESTLLVQVREKAGVPIECVSEIDQEKQALEDLIVEKMYGAGFRRVAVEDRPLPYADPRLRRPVWSKYVYAVTWKMTVFKAFLPMLVDIAREVDGCLVEWCYHDAKKGWCPISEDKANALTFQISIRLSIQSEACGDDDDCDLTKAQAEKWLKSKENIDFNDMAKALAAAGFALECPSQFTSVNGAPEVDYSHFTVKDTVVRDSSAALLIWAMQNWVWKSNHSIGVTSASGEFHQGIEVQWYEGKLTIQEEQDVPF